jgi:hypothetical protein
MRLQHAGWIVLAGALCATPLAAATPVISGNYVYVTRTLCQPTLTLQYAKDHNNQTFVNGVNLTTPESSGQNVGQASFDKSTATVTYSGTDDSGDNVLLQTSGGLQGAVISEKPQSGSTGYSNTATTVTLNGATFNATYGKSTKGVADAFSLVGLDSAGCSEQWDFTQQ